MFQPEAAPVVTDHTFTIFLPFHFENETAAAVREKVVAPLLRRTLGDVANALRTLGFSVPEPDDRLAPAFAESSRPESALDLHQQIADILYGQDCDAVGAGGRYRGMPPLVLRQDGLKLFGSENSAQGLVVRLNKDTLLPLLLQRCEIYLFGSGIGMIVLHLSFGSATDRKGQPTLDQLATVNKYLGRGRKMLKEGYISRANGGKPRHAIEAVAQCLFPALSGGQKPTIEPVALSRIFTFLAVRLARRLPTQYVLQRWAYVLGRALGSDQEPSDDELGRGFVQTRTYMTFAVAQEGGAVIVEPDTTGAVSDHSRDFLKKRLKTIYLPTCLAAYHEYETLVHLARAVEMPVDLAHPDEEALERLRALQGRLLDFRMNFRFMHVSRIGNHNRVYAEWRQALCLDVLAKEVTADVDEAARYLEFHTQREEARRTQAISEGQTGYGILAGALVLTAGVFGMNFYEFNHDPGLRLVPADGWQSFPTTSQLLVAAILVVIGVTAFKFARPFLKKAKALRKADRCPRR